jgi:hypothetical protein
MNYAGKAEQLLLGGQGQTEVPYSTEEQRLAAAQVLAVLALAEAIKDLSASIDMGLRGDGGSGDWQGNRVRARRGPRAPSGRSCNCHREPGHLTDAAMRTKTRPACQHGLDRWQH